MHISSWVLCHQQHLSLVRFGHSVAFEAVLVTALFLAYLTVEFELQETLGLDSVRNRFWCEESVFAHCEKLKRNVKKVEISLLVR